MEFYYYILIAVVIGLAYLVISRTARHKAKNKTLPNIVYRLMAYHYPVQSREGLIHKYINEEKTKAGVKKVKSGKFITQMSKRRAKEVDKANKASHEKVGDEFIELKKKGSDGSIEILARGIPTPKRVVKAWMRSESHREAILSNNDFDGVGCVLDENDDWIDIVIFVDELTIV